MTRLLRLPGTAGSIALALAAGAFLLIFLVIPVLSVIRAAVSDGAGGLTLGHFGAFFGLTLMRESFFNSLVVALLSVLFASLIAVPLAYLTARFAFRGELLIQTLGVLPLIMPPFVGAVAMQLIFGKSGTLNLLLSEHFDFSLPFMEGLAGVVFVESLHYFPFILLNLIPSCLATLQAPVIVMSQNRKEQKDRDRSKQDYMINLKSELEIRMIHEKLDHPIMHQQQELLEIQRVQIDALNEILERSEPEHFSPKKGCLNV